MGTGSERGDWNCNPDPNEDPRPKEAVPKETVPEGPRVEEASLTNPRDRRRIRLNGGPILGLFALGSASTPARKFFFFPLQGFSLEESKSSLLSLLNASSIRHLSLRMARSRGIKKKTKCTGIQALCRYWRETGLNEARRKRSETKRIHRINAEPRHNGNRLGRAFGQATDGADRGGEGGSFQDVRPVRPQRWKQSFFRICCQLLKRQLKRKDVKGED